jgi:hypothetical protein
MSAPDLVLWAVATLAWGIAAFGHEAIGRIHLVPAGLALAGLTMLI